MAEPKPVPSKPAPAGPVTIYDILDRRTGLHYVGITDRTLEKRIYSHLTDSRRDQPRDPRGLLHQLRERVTSLAQFHEQFDVRVLSTAHSLEQAAWLEEVWIERIGSRTPLGYNIQRGGASVGGPGNARPLVLRLGRKRMRFASIRRAIVFCNERAFGRGADLLLVSTVYARIVAGWSPEQACGLQAHDDGRSQRDPVRVGGKSYATLAAASSATGLSMATLRSRAHRARQAGFVTLPEIGTDRRVGGHLPMLGLRHPETDEVVSVRAYARAIGVPASTVLHRYNRTRKTDASSQRTAVERRKRVRLLLEDGRVVHGGYREVADQVTGNPDLKAQVCETLSHSGIRARLRKLTLAERSDPDCVRWACGMLHNRLSYEEVSSWRASRMGTPGSSRREAPGR